MKGSLLLKLTAIAETPIALALLLMPSGTTRALLGTDLSAPFEVTIARVAGSAILFLGIVCWMNRDFPFLQIRPLVIALLIYNVLVSFLLIQSGINTKLTPFLVVAVLAHVLLGVFCLVNLATKDDG